MVQLVQLVCAIAIDFISIEPECTYIYIILCFMHFIQRSKKKYGFMLIIRKVYVYLYNVSDQQLL